MNKDIAFLIFILTFLTNGVCAQPYTWTSVDGSKKGDEYTIKTLESNLKGHKVKVNIHGFYSRVLEKNGRRFHEFHSIKGHKSGLVGEPQLLYISQLIAVPEGASYNISVEEIKWADIEIAEIIYPTQKHHSESEPEPEFYILDKIYEQDTYIPPLLTIGREQKWRNIRNIAVSVCPFRYYPTKNKLSVLSSFVLHIDFSEASKESGAKSRDIIKASNEHYFDNDILSFPVDNRAVSNSNEYDYLIIVGNIPSILNSQKLKEFQQWKAFKGYKTKVVSTDTIDSTATDIKNYIIQERVNGIEYVLFIGDSDKIPLKAASTPQGHHALSDYWYGCLDGANDYEAEIPIGRFSTNSLSDFENMVNKTIAYEKSFNGYYDETLLVAHREEAPGNYQGCCEDIRNATYSSNFTFNLAYGASPSYEGLGYTNTDVVNDINTPMHIVNYRGHGEYNLWGDNWNCDNESFFASEINNINSCSIYFNVCCLTGRITNEPCFMETFTRSEKGAVACLASTERSINDINDVYNKKLFSKLLNENVWHIGDLNLSAFLATFSVPSIDLEWAAFNAYSYLCGGDPTLEIWTDSSMTFGDISLNRNNSSMAISIPSLFSTCTVSVISELGELIGNYEMTSSSCTIPIPSGNFYLSVHKHNYYPFVVFCSAYPYIQNKTFDINAYYDYSPLMVGYDVTTSEQYGDVTINPKSRLIINNGSNGVSIKNGFECKKGGQLIIQ